MMVDTLHSFHGMYMVVETSDRGFKICYTDRPEFPLRQDCSLDKALRLAEKMDNLYWENKDV